MGITSFANPARASSALCPKWSGLGPITNILSIPNFLIASNLSLRFSLDPIRENLYINSMVIFLA